MNLTKRNTHAQSSARALALALLSAMVATPALAGGGGTDFSGILTGLSGTTAVTAIVAAAAILALVGFAKWGAKKVAKFFG